MVVLYSCTSNVNNLLIDSGLVVGAMPKPELEPPSPPKKSPMAKKLSSVTRLPAIAPSGVLPAPPPTGSPEKKDLVSSSAENAAVSAAAGGSPQPTTQATSVMGSKPDSSARRVRVAHDATDALKDDVASHGKRLNPQRLAEARQEIFAIEHLHEAPAATKSKVKKSYADDTPGAESMSPRQLSRNDPSAAVVVDYRPTPFSMVATLSPKDLLPAIPAPDPLRDLPEDDFYIGRAGGSGAEAQRWLRQVASEASLQRRPQPKRFQMKELLTPLQDALDMQAASEQAQRPPEEERLRARVELYAAVLQGRIVPKVGHLDGQLGLALSSLLDELFSHATPLAVVAKKAKEQAATAREKLKDTQQSLEASQAQVQQLQAREAGADAEHTRAKQEAVRAIAKVKGLEHHIGQLELQADANKLALSDALTAARHAAVQQRESEREAHAAFGKALGTREQYEGALTTVHQEQQAGEELRAQVAELQRQIAQMSLDDSDRIKEVQQEARRSHMGYIEARNKKEEYELRIAELEGISEEQAATIEALQAALEAERADNASTKEALTLSNAKLLRAKREAEAAEGARRAQADEVDDLRRQVLSLRAQLAASEEARVDAWTKLQAVYSGDQASHLVREVLLIDEVEALEESTALAWRKAESLADLAARAADVQQELEEKEEANALLEKKLKETTLQVARSQAECARLTTEADFRTKQAIEALDYAQDVEKQKRQQDASHKVESVRQATHMKVLLAELSHFERETYDKLNTLHWKINMQSQQGKGKGGGSSAAARRLAGTPKPPPDFGMGGGSIDKKLDRILTPSMDRGGAPKPKLTNPLKRAALIAKKDAGKPMSLADLAAAAPAPPGPIAAPDAAPANSPTKPQEAEAEAPWANRERIAVQLTPDPKAPTAASLRGSPMLR